MSLSKRQSAAIERHPPATGEGPAALLKVTALGAAGVACVWQVTQTLGDALGVAGAALWVLAERAMAALGALF